MSTMTRKLRQIAITAAVAAGLIAATAAPATAGLNLPNHSEPVSSA